MTTICNSMFHITYDLLHLGQVSGWAKPEVESKAKMIKSTCLPLYSILLSVGNPVVDFFSLDIEGAENLVLNTIPWDKIHIRVRAFFHQKNTKLPVYLFQC